MTKNILIQNKEVEADFNCVKGIFMQKEKARISDEEVIRLMSKKIIEKNKND